MPFKGESIKELMRREKLDACSFAREFGEYVDAKGFGKKSCYNERSVSRWRTNKSNPPLRVIDALYAYAKERGHSDLEFYISSTNE